MARIAEAKARCASLTIGFRDVVTVTIPRRTCAIRATRLVVESMTVFFDDRYLVKVTMSRPSMKSPTTVLNNL